MTCNWTSIPLFSALWSGTYPRACCRCREKRRCSSWGRFCCGTCPRESRPEYVFGELVLFLCTVVFVSVRLPSKGTKVERNVLVELVIGSEMKEKLGFVIHFLTFSIPNLISYIKISKNDRDKWWIGCMDVLDHHLLGHSWHFKCALCDSDFDAWPLPSWCLSSFESMSWWALKRIWNWCRLGFPWISALR